MSTAQMIYPDKKVAQMILGKMQKLHPKHEWKILDRPNGFHVTYGATPKAPQSVLDAAPKTVAEATGSATTSMKAGVSIPQLAPKPAGLTIKKAEHMKEPDYLMKVATTGNAVNLTFQMLEHSKGWIRVLWNDKMYSLGLPLLLAYSIHPNGDKVSILMSNEYAKKRGFLS